MYYIIYKTTHQNGRYYIGRHQTENLDDEYFGSGIWVTGIKDKSELTREIIDEAKNIDDLMKLEERYIAENIDHPLNMNFKLASEGMTREDVIGNKHPLYITDIFCFINEDGRTFVGTFYEFRNTFPNEKFAASIMSVVNKERKTVGNGWYLRREDIPKKYTFEHTTGKKEVGITQYEMLKKYPEIRPGEFSRLISGKPTKTGKYVRSTGGWRIVKNIYM